MRLVYIAILALVLTTACSPRSDTHGPGGDVLTVFGEIGNVDRGPMDPETEPLFRNFGIAFDGACVFTHGSLASFEQQIVRTDFPAGGGTRRFSGPLVRDIIGFADGRGDMLVVTGLDGYQREIALSRVIEHDVILAIEMDGAPLPMGGLGPVMLVWPRGSDAALAGMNDDDWIWGVVAIEVTGDVTG